MQETTTAGDKFPYVDQDI